MIKMIVVIAVVFAILFIGAYMAVKLYPPNDKG